MVSAQNDVLQWRPACELSAIKARAQVYADIRAFFAERSVLEVETPLLSASTATDPFLASIPACVRSAAGLAGRQFYLHTSPEFPMKRLLAAGSGAIYQICKTFRDGESGRRHNPEFTMLEWYRPGFTLEQLMNEVAELVNLVLHEHQSDVHPISYREAFQQYLNIDPFTIADNHLQDLAYAKTGFSVSAQETIMTSRDDYLNLLLSHCIEPNLGRSDNGKPVLCFLHAYPASQASLAKVTRDEMGQLVAERFELYINGLEIANGYFELTDASEQMQRFEQDNRQREKLKLPRIPVDTRFLAALESGMPECSGVALGVDRLLMIKQQAYTLDEVMSFPIDRA
jgi:lysyl-tRNA synthetase class 2